MTALIVVIACGAVCYLLRLGPVELLARTQAPAWLDRVVVLCAPAALTAVAVTGLVAAPGGFADLLPRVAAFGVAVVVAHRTRSTAATIGAGMLTLWLITATCSMLP